MFFRAPLLILATLSSLALTPQVVVRVEVNGVVASYDGTPPQLLRGRVLVPVRGVFEQLGAAVTWDEEKKVVTATKDGHVTWLRIGDSTALRDKVPVILDVAPQLLDGRTLIPLRFVSEAMGCKVDWNGVEKLVSITTTVPEDKFPPVPPPF